MAYTANFSLSQSVDCTTISITDTSTNTVPETITNRKVFLQKADGTYLQPVSQSTYVAPIGAVASFALITIPTVGTTGVFTVYDPTLGQINFPYVSLISDNTLAILSTSFAAAITADPRGYTASYSASTGKITVTMPSSYGATGNYNGTPNTTGYFDVLNFLRNSLVYFAGGVNSGTIVQAGLNYYEFSPFLFPSNAITIPMPSDYALSIQLVNTPKATQIGSIYTKTVNYVLLCYLKTFRLGLISTLQATPTIINDINLKNSLFRFNTEINDAEISISDANDIANSQSSIDRANYMKNNQNLFF